MYKSIFFEKYYKYIKILFSIVGIWPYQNKKAAKYLRINCVIIHLSILIPQVSQYV